MNRKIIIYFLQIRYITFSISIKLILNEARPKEYSKLTAIQESSNVSEEMFSFPAVDQMIQDNLWICPIYTNSVNGCYYAPGSNSVSVPPKEQFKDGEYFYTSLFHELAHSTGHPDYLNREGITNLSALGSDNYAHEELVAINSSSCW